MTSNQIMLKQFIENHHFETVVQDETVIVLMPTYNDNGYLGNEAIICETVRDARNALGY